jgi:hypothetical protein
MICCGVPVRQDKTNKHIIFLYESLQSKVGESHRDEDLQSEHSDQKIARK